MADSNSFSINHKPTGRRESMTWPEREEALQLEKLALIKQMVADIRQMRLMLQEKLYPTEKEGAISAEKSLPVSAKPRS